MNIFFDESGSFRPSRSGHIEVAAVMGVVIPEKDEANFHENFQQFLDTLPKQCFVNGEPKGNRLSAEQYKSFGSLLNAHPGIMLSPVSFNRTIDPKVFDSFPQGLRKVLEENADKAEHESLRSELRELAKKAGNLSPEQIARLRSYKAAVEAALDAISTFYHAPSITIPMIPFVSFLTR